MLDKHLSRSVSTLVAAALLATSLVLPAQAALLPTETVVSPAAHEQRVQVAGMLARDDVRAKLVALGVDPAQVAGRLDSLTDTEVALLAERLEALPAGAGALELAVFVFLVLLLTDILGYTDIFPFVTKPARR
jgi:hypothetical protein